VERKCEHAKNYPVRAEVSILRASSMASILLRRARGGLWIRRTASKMSVTAWLLLLVSSPPVFGDWLTFGHDPQRSGWSFEENKLTPANVGDLELKWQVQLNNQ